MTPHLINPNPLNLMIPRIRRRLIENITRRPSQLHPQLPLKPNITESSNIILPIREVIDKKQRHPSNRAKPRPLDGNLLDLGCLRQLKGLRGFHLLGDGEVDVVAVDDDLEGARGGGGGGCPEEEGVEFYLTCKPSSRFSI